MWEESRVHLAPLHLHLLYLLLNLLLLLLTLLHPPLGRLLQ